MWRFLTLGDFLRRLAPHSLRRLLARRGFQEAISYFGDAVESGDVCSRWAAGVLLEGAVLECRSVGMLRPG